MTEYHSIIIGSTAFDYNGRPLGPYRLRSACAKSGYNVKVIDFGFSLNSDQMLSVLKSLISDKTLVLGLSSAWMAFNDKANQWFTLEFFARFKSLFPRIKIVVGGTRNISKHLSYDIADWRFTGFSDISFPLLLDKLSGKDVNLKFILDKNLKKVIHSDQQYIVENMDDIETELLQEDNFLKYQPFTIELSRGCIFKCAFCSHPFLGKKSYEYIRTPESIARELKRNYELFGMTKYMLADDTFNDSMEKLDRLDQALEISGVPNFEFTCYLRGELLATKPEMIPKLKHLGLRGYHIGLESFNPTARKAIGKGMDVEKVLDAVRNLNSNSKARGHTSIILGLPEDTEEDFYKWEEYLEQNVDSLFQSWRHYALGLTKPQDGTTYSLIEQDPTKYGYTTWTDNNEQFYNWAHSSGMTYEQAVTISSKLNDQAHKYWKLGGWDVATAWFMGLTDNEIEIEKSNGQFWKTARAVSIKRSRSNFKKITGTDLDTGHL
jgi:radical SAM superfamily enzyme YgiQ (UPF0313 family)